MNKNPLARSDAKSSSAVDSRLAQISRWIRSELVLVILIASSLALHWFFIAYFGDIDFEPDSYAHFLFSRSTFAKLPRSLNYAVGVWPKPLFTLITGLIIWISRVPKLWIIKVFNSLIWTGVGLLARNLALRLKLPKDIAAISFFCTQFSFLAFRSSMGTLTEPLFTLLVMSAISALYAKRYTWSCAFMSLSVLARSEGMVLSCVWVIILWMVCKRRSIYDLCMLGLFPLLWNAWGYTITGNPTFIISTGYPVASAPYGHGGWFDYLIGLLTYEPVIFPLALLGGILTMRKRKYAPIHIIMLVYFGFNIVSWRFGLFGTAGLLRYFVAVVPLLSIYAASALKFRDLLAVLKRPVLLGVNPLLWQIAFTIAILNSHTSGYMLYNTPTVHHGLVEAGKWVQEKHSDEYLYASHSAVLYYADRDFYTGSRVIQPKSLTRDGLVAFENGFGTLQLQEYLSHFELLDTFGHYVYVHDHQITPIAVRPNITFGTDDVCPHLSHGWSEPEGWGTWALGPYSEFALYFPNPTTATVTISAMPQFVDGKQQTIDIDYNDVPVGKYTFVNDAQDLEQFSFQVPRSLISGRLDRIRFTYGYATSPYDLGISNDGRKLAVGFVEMTITPR